LQKFKWAISYSDGHVTTHKMLEFINKRTERDVIYKPTLSTMLTTFFGFISVAAAGVFIYTKLKFIWTNWAVWLVGSLLIYITCVSGVIYDILHDVPFVGRDRNTGEVVIFAEGNREQYGAEGLVISTMIVFIGILFVSIIVMGQKLDRKISLPGSMIALLLIYYLVASLESVYKSKGWYGPSFSPPEGYLTGPITRDQGNNI
jgi:oligosaccharyltransferase complex subunit gamma